MASVGKVLRLYPGPSAELDVEEVYADLSSPRPSGRGAMPHVAINMVSTLDGKVSIGGKAGPIGGRLDRSIMRNIRSAFDAVVVGAGTVRAEEMNLGVPAELSEKRKARGLSEQPVGVILAGSGDLPLDRKLFRPGRESPTVIAGRDAPEGTLRDAACLGVRVLRTPGFDLPQPREILRLLKEDLDVGTVLLEGGPSVNGAFLASGNVDELFLTLSPKISLSRQDTLTLASTGHDDAATTADLELASVHSSPRDGELYLRYLRTNPRTT